MIQTKKLLENITRMSPNSEGRIGQVYRFDRNEKTIPFPEDHLKNILNTIHPDEMTAYPNLVPFYQRLVQWLKVDRENVLVWAGSDTAIRAVYEVYVEGGDEVVILSPTYGMFYVYGRMFGATTKEVFYDNDFSLPVERILAEINEKTKCVVLSNPNHTGTVIRQDDLLKIIKAAQKVDALMVLDEAYYHFNKVTMLAFINDFDNLLIIRTFSKAFGIASLRIGYTVSNKEIISHLDKVKLTHEITSFSAKVGCYMLDHLEILNDYVKDVNEAKDVLYSRMPEMGFEVLNSEGNFVFFKGHKYIDGKDLMAELEKEKMFIKGPFSNVPFSGHLRVSVGTSEQMNMFCDTITRIIKKNRSGLNK